MKLKTTGQAAKMVKRTRSPLHLLLYRYPNLPLAQRLPNGPAFSISMAGSFILLDPKITTGIRVVLKAPSKL